MPIGVQGERHKRGDGMHSARTSTAPYGYTLQSALDNRCAKKLSIMRKRDTEALNYVFK